MTKILLLFCLFLIFVVGQLSEASQCFVQTMYKFLEKPRKIFIFRNQSLKLPAL